MSANLTTIRTWVLLSQAYCEQPNRHILFDLNGQFLGWMDNAETDTETQNKLNTRRSQYVAKGSVSQWLPGAQNQLGYPFAFACEQPHVDLNAAINRLLGRDSLDRLWGTWDGMQAGTKTSPVPLIDVVKLVWQQRNSQLENPLSSLSFTLFLSQLVIESGAVKSAHSKANAIGILQLRPEAFTDCGIDKKFYQHRMAQVDCAARLYVLNRRNLEPIFLQRFGHLPTDKRERLFGLLLVQTYHSGIGNMRKLLQDNEQSKAAAYFAQHHTQFSADDIVTGMLFHNLGREPWGWESLFYLLDIAIAETVLCKQPESRDLCAQKPSWFLFLTPISKIALADKFVQFGGVFLRKNSLNLDVIFWIKIKFKPWCRPGCFYYSSFVVQKLELNL